MPDPDRTRPLPPPRRAPAAWVRVGAWRAALLLGATLSVPAGAAASTPTVHQAPSADTLVTREREDAVRVAREGRLEEGRDRLLRLRERHPGDLGVLGDLLVVLGWMGDDERILAEARSPSVSDVAPYALEALARARRNRQDPEGAAALYREILSRDPARRESRIGLALSLRESGQPAEGLQVLDPLLVGEAPGRDVSVAAAHLFLAMDRPVESAGWYREALEAVPGDPEAWRGRALALSAMGAPHLAAEQVEARPEVFTPAERELILGDRAAAVVRWGELPASDPTHPLARAEAARTLLEGRVASVPEGLPFHRNRARFDRMVALAGLGLHGDVLSEWESLRDEGVEFPPYVLKVVGDALVQLRRPREAVEVLGASLGSRPDHVETRLSLFYARVEAEDLDGALAGIDSLVARQPEWRWAPGLLEPRENPDRVRAESAALMGRAFAGRLAEAQAGFERMVDRAPMNAALRAELASVYRFRGWPRRAVEEAELAAAADTASLPPRIARAGALLEARRWRDAEREVDALRRHHSGSPHVRRLASQHDLERGWSFAVEADAGRSSGVTLGSEDASGVVVLRSPVSDAGFRAHVRGWGSGALFDPGRARTERVEGGVQLDRSRGWLSAMVSREVGENGRTGVGGALGLRAGDRLELSLTGESRSSLIPLQARLAEVDGWSAGASLRIRWHEGRTASLDASRIEMDDGNTRHTLYALLEQRLATTPRLKLSATLEGYGSTGSLDGTPYFSPSRDVSSSAGLVAEWITWRRWERSFEQRLTVSGGAYGQEGFDVEPTGLVRYEHLWRTAPALGFRYGITFWRRAFDGAPEDRTSVSMSLDWRIP